VFTTQAVYSYFEVTKLKKDVKAKEGNFIIKAYSYFSPQIGERCES